jgi:pimeloyl-ACP methyl ester carboxylesterase
VKIFALHGLPTSPRLWERIPFQEGWTVDAPICPGLGPDGTPEDWSLGSCVEQLKAQAEKADVLVGHDMGGVLVAMLAQPGQRVVLSGTSLGSRYWTGIRMTAWPGLQRFFYARYSGRRFLKQGGLPEHADGLLEAFGDHGTDWSERMRRIARGMQPPKDLVRRLDACDVGLAWGRSDPWYPLRIPRELSRKTGADLHLLNAGHFAPWEDPVGFEKVLRGALP